MRTKYRIYCKKCQDFTLHDRVYVDEFKHEKYATLNFEGKTHQSLCLYCDTVYTPVNRLEIDQEKINVQQLRYKQQQRKFLFEPILLLQSTYFGEFMPKKSQVIESDAGLIKQQEQENIKKQALKNQAIQDLEKYKTTNRNDKCPCGSGIKYKKCHLHEIEQLKKKFKI